MILSISNPFEHLCGSIFLTFYVLDGCATFLSSYAVPSFRSAVDNDEIVSSQDTSANSTMRHPLRPRNRY